MVLIFLLTAAVSFLGSLQIGPVNYYVVSVTVATDNKRGILAGIGGSIPEFVYSFLAIVAGSYLQQFPVVFDAFRWISAVAMFLVGCVLLLRPVAPRSAASPHTGTQSLFFWKGFLLGLFNPQLMPFWLLVYTSYSSVTGLSVNHLPEQVAFVAGTGCGAFLLQLLLIYLTDTFRTSGFIRRQTHIQYVIGSIFVILAIAQALIV